MQLNDAFISFHFIFFYYFIFLNFILFIFCLLGMNPRHVEVPRLGTESELQLLAKATATAMPYPSRVCRLHHSSQQSQILNPLDEARDPTHILMDLSWVH